MNVFYFIVFLANETMAASGPIAKDFGADDWMDRIHVVFTVIGLVTVTTTILIILILKKK